MFCKKWVETRLVKMKKLRVARMWPRAPSQKTRMNNDPAVVRIDPLTQAFSPPLCIPVFSFVVRLSWEDTFLV
jgi:hypothetical protein